MRYFILTIALAFSMLFVFSCGSPRNDGVVVLDGPILESVNKDGFVEFNGAVINTGENPVTSVYIVIVLKDSKGNIIEGTSTSLYEEGSDIYLYPSDREFFKVTVDSDPSRVFTKDVEIYYDEVL